MSEERFERVVEYSSSNKEERETMIIFVFANLLLILGACFLTLALIPLAILNVSMLIINHYCDRKVYWRKAK